MSCRTTASSLLTSLFTFFYHQPSQSFPCGSQSNILKTLILCSESPVASRVFALSASQNIILLDFDRAHSYNSLLREAHSDYSVWKVIAPSPPHFPLFIFYLSALFYLLWHLLHSDIIYLFIYFFNIFTKL